MATGKKLFSLIAFVALCLTFFVHAEKTKDDKERQNSKYGTVGICCDPIVGPALFTYIVWQKGYFHPFPLTVGIFWALLKSIGYYWAVARSLMGHGPG